MQSAQNTQVVKDAYAAFGRGDIPALLETVHEDVVWYPVTGAGPQVPTAGEYRGKAGVAEFFRILSTSMTFEQFEPQTFVAQDDTVCVLGHYKARPIAGGQGFESDWVMVFTLRDGKLVRFQEFSDSAAINAAFATAGAAA